MELKNYQIKSLYESLISLKNNQTVRIPIKLGFNILNNISMLENFYKNIETIRNEIILPNIESQLDNNTVRIKSEKIQEVNDALQELLNIECEVELSIFKLEELEEFKLTLDELNGLMPIIK